MVTKPDHISEQEWKTLTDDDKAVEHEANQLLGSEFICRDTILILACLDHNVMSRKDIINYPQPQDWSAEQCAAWCHNHRIDFRSMIEGLDRAAMEAWLADVIQFGMDDIETDCLRRILVSRLDNKADYGLSLWRDIVKANAPDIYEWWGVEEELADDLIEIGDCVLKNQYGHWWGRGCTGQDILIDGTLQAVVRKRRRIVSGQAGQPP
ncbi:MAG: hypothetical protein ABSF26_10660 [Thermoguttaceae bacterium]|jgi:hypothetical protein